MFLNEKEWIDYMENKCVSIIIPVYNTKKYLSQCVDSVLAQTYSNLQVILVDDGSTDGSDTLCDDYKIKDSRVDVIHKKNEGLGLTRNKGLELANGEYVTFLDSDDWIDKDHIKNLISPAYSTDYDVIFGTYTKATNEGQVLDITELPYQGEKREIEIKNQIMFAIIAADNGSKRDLGIPMGVCFNLYKTSIINQYGLRFPSEKVVSSEDIFFNLEYLNLCKSAYFTTEAGYYYRFNPNSITKGYDELQEQRTELFYNQLSSCVKMLGMPTDVTFRIERCMMAKIRGLLSSIVRSSFERKEKLHKIRELLNKPWVCSLMENYQMPDYRFTLRVTTICMKYKFIHMLYLILYTRERITKK